MDRVSKRGHLLTSDNWAIVQSFKVHAPPIHAERPAISVFLRGQGMLFVS